MPIDFERPRQAPVPPPPKADLETTIGSSPESLRMTSPSRSKTSWFSSGSTEDAEDSALQEEAPGLMSRSALLAGLETPPKPRKDKSRDTKSPKTPTTVKRISRGQGGTSSTNNGTTRSDVTPTRSSIFSFRSASKQEKTPRTTKIPSMDERKPKSRPLSLASLPRRLSSQSSTPKGLYSMTRGSPRGTRVDVSDTLAVLQGEPVPAAKPTAIPGRTSSIPSLPPRLPPDMATL
jgi:hypothetical protein